MATVNFYLKKAEPSTGKSLIYLQFKYNGQRLVFSFGQSVDPDKKTWNYSKQRVKNNKTTTAEGDHLLNDLLDNLKTVCEKAYKEELKNGVPTPATLKMHLIDFINQNQGKEKPKVPSLFQLIDKFKSGEILTAKNKQPSKGSINNYRTVKIHLTDFERKYRYPIRYDTITLDFFHKYVSYLANDLNLKANTIAKDISIIKLFMREAFDREYTDNLHFKKKKFAYAEERTESVYLNETEILKLFRHDLSSNKTLEHARDLFVFGCFSGLRYSDYSNVKAENIISREDGDYIKLITQKTDEDVEIPVHPIVSEIFNKYHDRPNRLPRAYSGQKFNEYIKKACRIAELTEKGRIASQPDKELCECISSHTARRSFATNYYLQGFPTIDLMKITGHRTEKAFLSYIKVTKPQAAKRLNDHIKKHWTGSKLRVA